MDKINKQLAILGLSLLYFAVILVLSFFTFKNYPVLKFCIGITRIPILILIYYIASQKKNYVFILALSFLLLAFLLFLVETETMSFIGAMSTVMYKFLLLTIVFKSIKNKNWVALSLASIPFLFTYLYFVFLISDFLNEDIFAWSLNGLITSFIGGIALYNFTFEDENKNFWLLISSILFVIQIGVFFIHKYYIEENILRTLTIILFGVSNFTFYKFMISNEEKENDHLIK